MISPEWRRLNAEMHARDPRFGSRGRKWRRRIQRIVTEHDCRTVLDYGCGKGGVKGGFAGIPVVARYDPAVPEIAGPPEPADLVVCTDVLEHVEPEHIDAALDHLKALTLNVVFFVVATRPSDKTMADGRNAHLIIEPMGWWMPKIAQRWRILEAHDSGERGFWRDRGLRSPPLDPGREFSVLGRSW